jgi:hypothetical protein
VQKIKRPVAGFSIEFISSRVILGGKNPLLFDCNSSIAEESGEFVPIPTWPNNVGLTIK